jgi:hypothetical protein
LTGFGVTPVPVEPENPAPALFGMLKHKRPASPVFLEKMEATIQKKRAKRKEIAQISQIINESLMFPSDREPKLIRFY